MAVLYGDLGFQDQDGYFFVTGRSKEMIVLSTGKKIFPEELEAVYKQIPSIQDFLALSRPSEESKRRWYPGSIISEN